MFLKNAKPPTKNRMFLSLCLLVMFLIVIAIEFIKNTQKSRMFLRTGLLELWILFIRLFNVIIRWKEKYLPQITLKEVTIFAINSWKLSAIRDLWWLNLRPVTVQNATLYFHLLSWHFFFFFLNLFFDEVLNFCNRILTNQKQEEYVIKNCQWNCT